VWVWSAKESKVEVGRSEGTYVIRPFTNGVTRFICPEKIPRKPFSVGKSAFCTSPR